MSDTPLHALALLADRRGAALVARDGAIEWCCAPRFDSGACFGALLDDRAGACTVELDGGGLHHATASYIGDSLVHQITATNGQADATVSLTDAFVPGAEPMRLARVVRCEEGSVDAAIRIRPRFDYGQVRPWVRLRDEHHGSLSGGDDSIVVASSGVVERVGDHELIATAHLEPGDELAVSLRFVAPELVADDMDVATCTAADDLATAERAFGRFLECTDPGVADDPAVRRSILTLLALVYEPTGAILAAPTTSLPESPSGTRNWDYRYAWIRDATLTSRALAEVGLAEIGDAFSAFTMRSTAGHPADMQVVYGIGGERRLDMHTLDLDGWRGAQPVHVGNGAAGQVQRDEPGEILQQCRDRHDRGYRFDDDEWRYIARLARHVAHTWDQPGHGFWEVPGPPRRYVQSIAAAYGALDAATAIGRDRRARVPDHWTEIRDACRTTVLGAGFDEHLGCFRQALEGEALDASVLLLPHTGVIDWNDDRMRSTVDVIADRLEDHGGLRRYDLDDGLPGREGCFIACSFWLAECLARQGRQAEAREWFARATATASPLGLYSEEWDAPVRSPLGNYPQALTHLAHVQAARALAAAEHTASTHAGGGA